MAARDIHVCSIPHASMNPYISSMKRELARLGVAFAEPAAALKDIRERLRPDLILHFHWPSAVYGGRTRSEFEQRTRDFVELLDHAKALRCHVVWTAHNVFPHENPFPDLDLAARRQFMQRCDHILAHCAAGHRELAAAFPDLPAVTIVPHPHYRDDYPSPPDRAAARSALHLPPGDFVFLMFGLLRGYKNFPLAVSAFRAAGLPRARLVIAGGSLADGDSSEVRRLVNGDDRIELRDRRIPHAEVPVLFGAANVALFAYHRILASGGVALAHSMGRAVIAPRIGCLPEMVPENAGILYEAGSPESLLAAMRRIVEIDADEMGRRGQDHIAPHAPGTLAAKILAIYEDLRRRGNTPSY